jgi:hypothetical protein
LRTENSFDSWNQLTSKIGFAYKICGSYVLSLGAHNCLIILTDENYLRIRQISKDCAGRSQTVHARHGNVHEDQVGAKRFALGNGFHAILSLTANGDIWIGSKKRTQAVPDGLMIIDN